MQLVASHTGTAYEEALSYKWRLMAGGGSLLGSNTGPELTFNVGNYPSTNTLYCDVTCENADDSPATSGPIYIAAG